jgi:hypothetical protein
MDRPSIQLRLQQAESLAQRLAENVAFQQQTMRNWSWTVTTCGWQRRFCDL